MNDGKPASITPSTSQFFWSKVKGVVLFADLDAFFPIVRKTGLEDLGSFMQAFYSLCSSEIRRQKGETISFVGDAVLGFYQGEKCGGMDAEWCATITAFHLVKNLKKFRPDLEINVGITTGEVLDGRWDEDGRLFRALVGDVVNRGAILAGGRIKGIHVSKTVQQVLGPRVSHEKTALRFPGTNEDEIVYRLTSLVL